MGVLIGSFLKRIRRPVEIENTKKYKLVTVKLHHKGVVLREIKLGSEIRSKKMYAVKTGDFILSGIDARNGAFGIVPEELDGAVVTNDFWYFQVDELIIKKKLFLELTQTSWFDEICRKGSDGTTQRIRLQKSKFFNQIISLPEPELQTSLLSKTSNTKRITQLLSAEASHQQVLLKKLRQSILQDAISGKLTEKWRKENPEVESASELLKRIKTEKERLVKEKKIPKQKPLPPITEEEIPFELPEGWVWCRLGDVCLKLSTGPFGSMLHKSDYVEEGIPLVNPINLIGNKIFPNSKMMVNEKTKARLKQFVLDIGDIVIARRGDLSKCAVVYEKESGWLCGTGSFFLSISKYIQQSFFLFFYISNYCQGILNNTSVGSTMNNLNQKLLQSLLFPFPPVKEQKKITGIIDRTYNICDQLESQITKSQQDAESLMQAVLKEAFEG
ncbi:MAG: hypothetical protein C4518_14195 [Desulfobacteraceae bacterium]|nr:MAG: hypothetical protein C4518_14195 [Desulfobacteraceae bacterium]